MVMDLFLLKLSLNFIDFLKNRYDIKTITVTDNGKKQCDKIQILNYGYCQLCQLVIHGMVSMVLLSKMINIILNTRKIKKLCQILK